MTALRTTDAPAGGRTAAWATGAALAVVVLMALAVRNPTLPVLLLVGLLVVGCAVFRPKAYAVLAIAVILLSTPIQNIVGSAGSNADEAVTALAVVAMAGRRFVTEGRLVWLPGSGWFLGFLVAGFLSSAMAGVPLGSAAITAFIAIKGVLLAFALAQLRWTRDDLVTLVRLGVATSVAVALSGLLNIAFPTPWALLTTGRAPIEFVGPIPAINGIFQHPAAFSRFAGVLAVAALVYGLVVRRSMANVLLVVASAGLAFLTLQVKSIVGMLVTLALVGVGFVRWVGAAALACILPLVALVAAPPLISLIGADAELYLGQNSARSQLTSGGFTVADQYFPLGAGFGRYGSSTAAEHYSPIYYDLGFADRFGLGPGPKSGQFLNDTQWPAILGEAGWIGAFCFAAGLACMAVSLLRRTSRTEPVLVTWIRITGIGWMVLLLVESVAAPVFSSSPSFPFVFAAAGIVASLRSASRSGDDESSPDEPSGGGEGVRVQDGPDRASR